jgi:hypothetical protein
MLRVMNDPVPLDRKSVETGYLPEFKKESLPWYWGSHTDGYEVFCLLEYNAV